MASQCCGVGRYAIRCRRYTNDPSGLCRMHQDTDPSIVAMHREADAREAEMRKVPKMQRRTEVTIPVDLMDAYQSLERAFAEFEVVWETARRGDLLYQHVAAEWQALKKSYDHVVKVKQADPFPYVAQAEAESGLARLLRELQEE